MSIASSLTTTTTPPPDDLRRELRRRMSRPQRHRLLQGYPMAPLMRPARPGLDERSEATGIDPLADLELDASRPLIIGVLPHTFCNPKVRGCGFCTFPHEKFGREAVQRTVAQVAREIEAVVRRHRSLGARRVEAVYVGGGTANLTPPDELHRLYAVLGAAFDLRDAELTLEGVPRYFLARGEAHLDELARAGVRHRRISMGVQTFDPAWLRRMGRDAFGDRGEIEQLVAAAHRRGLTASADLLFDLPGASPELALADVRTAIELGFDQICAYKLVLTADLDTEWARDRSLLEVMPDSATSHATWQAVRATLLERSYVQTTLTNFERAELVSTPRRFTYEAASFDPAARDGIGFGPGAISTFTSRDHQTATKWQNLATSEAYVAAMVADRPPVATVFDYTRRDLQLLHLTRNIAALAIDCAAYGRWFGGHPVDDFPREFHALEQAGLIRYGDQTIELTPDGMYYADAVAGLLARERTAVLWADPDDRAARRYHMG